MLSFQLKLENLPVEWVANQANKPPKIPSFKFTLNNNSSCVTPSRIALVFAYQYFIFDAKQLSAKQASAIFKFSFLVPIPPTRFDIQRTHCSNTLDGQ